MGGLGQGEASSEVIAGIINSPSADCNRLLQVADLHAAASQADSLRQYMASVPKQFLIVSVAMKVRHPPAHSQGLSTRACLLTSTQQLEN